LEFEKDRAGLQSRIAFLEGGGELGALIRAHDWSRTSLGPIDRWPQSLRSAVSILLPSKAQIVVFWGPDLIAIYNDAYRPVFGGKHPGALGKPAREAWSEIWDAGLRDLLETVLHTGEAFWAKDRPFYFLERHGYPEETYFDVSYDPIRDESGGVGGVFCIVSETTARVLADRRVKTLRELAEKTADARSRSEACKLAIGALASDREDVPFVLVYRAAGEPALECASPGAEALSDPSRWPLADVIRENAAREIAIGDTDAGTPSGPWPRAPERVAILPIVDHRGPAAILVVGLSPVRAYDEDYRGFLELAARQIGAAIANADAREEERERAESLAELDRAKTAFFSNVSHEFRTPLTLILAPLEDTLALGADLSPPQRERLEVAHRNALRLLKLVNTMLDFARIEAGRFDSSFEATDLGRWTAELASVFRSAVERAGLRLVVDCPPLDEPVHVDRERWEKIVFNLLSNAFKFTFEGSIEVRVRRKDDRVELVVRDTGTGIAPEDLPHVFERFHRVRGARGRSFEGSGIGLALVSELVKLHHGTIEVTSTVGVGTEFRIAIPTGTDHLPAARLGAPRTLASTEIRADSYLGEMLGWLAPKEREGDSSRERQDGRPRVLVADDNADMREYVRALLSEHFDVETVSDGAAALRAARERPPQLFVADVMMPELDGFGLLREVRADERLRALPFILVSARAGEEARVEGIEAGADDYLVKPFSGRELVVRVASRLELGRLQARLERDRAELAALFTQSPIAIAVLRGPNLLFDLANPAYIELTGGRDVAGLALADALPELESQGVGERLRGVMRTGVPYAGRESPLRLERHGRMEDAYFNVVYAPLRGSEDRADGVIMVCHEVTSEVGAREAIAKSEARYRNIFESAGVSIWEEDFSAVKAAVEELARAGVTDFRRYFAERPEFVQHAIGLVRVLDVNDAALRMLAAKDKSEIVASLHRIFLPETAPAFVEELVMIAEKRSYFATETVVRKLSGERCDVLLTISFAKHDPDLKNALVTLTDITARKDVERVLQDQTRTLETLNEVGRTLAAEVDLERIVQKVTDAATALSGAEFGAFFYNVTNDAGEAYTLYTLSGAPREAFSRFGMPRNTAVFAPTFTGDAVVRLDDVTKDPRYGKSAPHHGMPVGHLPVRSYLAVPVISRSGGVIGGLFFGHSRAGVFTERAQHLVEGIASQAAVAFDNARLHEQRLHLIEQLRDADRRKDEFLATLSHELRNPLAPLRNSLHLLRLSGHGGSLAPMHEMMDRQINHLVRLVDDLLEMSRVSRGAFELRQERVEIAAIVRNAVETSNPLIQSAHHELSVSLPSDPLWVHGDPVRLAQVLSNLLNNSAKYTEPGGSIRLDVRREDASAILTVEDNGAGISKEALKRVFEMFSRGDRAGGRDLGGLGIGLALARKLAEMHGGTLTATSDGRGRGSRFSLRLPLATDQATRTSAEELMEPALPRKRILVVDDNHDSAESLSMLLDFLGAEVKVAFDGTEALATFASYDPAVVLLDIGMPGMDGYEVARRIRAQHPDRASVLVALTGWGQEEDRRRAKDAGFDHHLIKPADIGALKALLGSLDDGAR
jgi:signal transduction histidine kinase/DNA-binding response OmpR family regulator